MNEAPPPVQDDDFDATQLLRHYRPLGLKAVLAACIVKRHANEPARVEQPGIFGNLPEGFHMPQTPDD